MSDREHPFSWQALGRIIAAGMLALLVWQALGVFIDILIALILATAVYPIVRAVNQRIPFVASAIIVLVLLLIPFVLFGIFIAPNLIRELPDMLKNFYAIIKGAHFVPQAFKNFDLSQYLSQHSAAVLDSTRLILTSIVSVISVFFLMFYLVIDHERLLGLFLDLFPNQEKKKIQGLLEEVALVNGQYIRGNVIISIICAAFLFVGLFLLHVPYALPLAIFAGILDLLPLVGSTLGAVPAVIFAFAISPSTGILVIALHLIYQQLENVIISPAIYNKALHISPALSFLAVIIGAGVFGILGAFLALPIAASIPAVIRYMHGYSERNA